MGVWRSLAFEDISGPSVRKGLADCGVAWESGLHVAATSSLTTAIRAAGGRALTIRDLIDLVMSADPSAASVLAGFPSLSGLSADQFSAAYDMWAAGVPSRSPFLGVRADLLLRQHLEQRATPAALTLSRAVPRLRRSIQGLSVTGYRPGDLSARTDVVAEALDAWGILETQMPELFQLRDDLWCDRNAVAQAKTPEGTYLRDRISRVLAELTGSQGEMRATIVYHGFYFFTPPQWAWFQLLRAFPDIDQNFVVHDDGANPAFEIWRRFFCPDLDMPPSEYLGAKGRVPGPGGESLRAALEGRPVDMPPAAARVDVSRFETAAQFASAWRSQEVGAATEGRPRPRLFAANRAEIARLLGRFSGDAPDGSVDLGELPIGQFLIALHACVSATDPAEVTLGGDRLVDMASSGLLDLVDGRPDPSHHLPGLVRAMPFFDDVDSIDDWVTRATDLRAIVRSGPAGLPGRRAGVDDVARISGAVENPFRLLPWLDLSADDAEALLRGVNRVKVLATQLGGATDGASYITDVRRSLAGAMRAMPAAIQQQIDGKLNLATAAWGSGAPLDVQGIKDIVNIILGRQAALGLDGLVDDADEPTAFAGGPGIADLRSLDALAFERPEHDLHVANLSEANYPQRAPSIGWPFDRDITLASTTSPAESRQLVRTREEAAGLGDLYLLWLALDSPRETSSLTLSWIGEVGSESFNPSPLLSLIVAPDRDRSNAALRDAIGGLPVVHSGHREGLGPVLESLGARRWDRQEAAIEAALSRVDPVAASSIFACPRRFVLQWALGESASYAAPHHQAILFGNLQGALERKVRYAGKWEWPFALAKGWTERAWTNLSPGARASSLKKRRAGTRNGTSRWQWLYSLIGSYDRGLRGRDDLPPVPTPNAVADLAYTAAIERFYPGALDAAPDDGLLPPIPALDEPDPRDRGLLCRRCPVRSRCLAASYR